MLDRSKRTRLAFDYAGESCNTTDLLFRISNLADDGYLESFRLLNFGPGGGNPYAEIILNVAREDSIVDQLALWVCGGDIDSVSDFYDHNVESLADGDPRHGQFKNENEV